MRGIGLAFAVCLVAILAIGCAGGSNDRPASSTAGSPSPPPAATPAASAAGVATASPEIASGTVMIEAGDHFFSPARLTVKVGTTVVWKIVGQSTHDIVAADGSFASSVLTFGNTFSYTFRKPGRYPYFCTPHGGDGMIGEIVVE